MNHGSYGIFNKYTPLILGHRKFTTDKPFGSGFISGKLPLTSDSGHIFVEYT